MTSLKKKVLSAAIVTAIVAMGLINLAWAPDRLQPGQPGPLFGMVTFVLLAITIWATRSGVRRDGE